MRTDTSHFLRGPDVVDGGRDDQFYWVDENPDGDAEAPRDTLALASTRRSTASTAAKLKDGKTVKVAPVLHAAAATARGLHAGEGRRDLRSHPDIIRHSRARSQTRTTHDLMGWNSGKYYHGDLMERSMMLVLALTGNWGKKGTGTRSWAVGMFDGQFFAPNKPVPGQEMPAWRTRMAREAMMRAAAQADPTMTDEIANDVWRPAGAAMGGMVPPAFFWYYHCGYQEIWNKKTWGDSA